MSAPPAGAVPRAAPGGGSSASETLSNAKFIFKRKLQKVRLEHWAEKCLRNIA